MVVLIEPAAAFGGIRDSRVLVGRQAVRAHGHRNDADAAGFAHAAQVGEHGAIVRHVFEHVVDHDDVEFLRGHDLGLQVDTVIHVGAVQVAGFVAGADGF